MSKAKHTAGPRTVVERPDWWDVVDQNGDRITSFDKSDERSYHDALLDALAPEMYEVLKDIYEDREVWSDLFPDQQERIEELIKKIEG